MHSTVLTPFAGFLLAAAASAIVVQPAEVTGRLINAVVDGPAPTSPPTRRWPDLFERKINSDATCGFYHYFDNPNDDTYPVTCANSGSICTVSGPMRNCCNPTSNCATVVFPTVCLDSAACPYLSTTWPTGTMCCESSGYPYCHTDLWSTTAGDVYTFFACGVSSTSRIGVIEAYASGSSPTPTPSTTTITPEPTTPTTTTPAPTTTSPVPDNGGSSSNTGAIVGGVVGGLAVVGIVTLATFFLLRKKKGNDVAGPATGSMSSPNPPPAPQPQLMMPEQTGMSQPYDPRQSYFGAQSPPAGYPPMAANPASPYGPNASPAQGGISPAQGGVSPAQRDISPAQGGISPAQRDISPAQGDISPAQRDISPAQGGISPAQRDISPAQGGNSPQPESVSPQQSPYAAVTPEKQLENSSPPQVAEVGAINPRGMVGGNNPVELSA